MNVILTTSATEASMIKWVIKHLQLFQQPPRHPRPIHSFWLGSGCQNINCRCWSANLTIHPTVSYPFLFPGFTPFPCTLSFVPPPHHLHPFAPVSFTHSSFFLPIVVITFILLSSFAPFFFSFSILNVSSAFFPSSNDLPISHYHGYIL